jgi:deazaflavin-dependent oxidoreductase (nitroreductase family)
MPDLPDELQAYNRQLIEQFRKKRGPAQFRPLLLLNTIGARSGRRRTTPMMYVPDGDRLLVLASNAGAPAHPDWYHNLVANPEVTVELGPETYDAVAVIPSEEERDGLFHAIVERYPFFAEHQARAGRRIPVVVLQRRTAGELVSS